MFSYVFRMFRYGMSYFIATIFFAKDIRKAVLKLYSFVRIPDNIVDVVDWWFDIKSNAIYCENKECWLSDKNSICRHRCRSMLNKHYQNAFVQLQSYYNQWKTVYTNQDVNDQVLGEYVQLFQDYKIPFEYSKSFFDSMIMDCSASRYNTYKQLDEYMYGSAAVVGLMMCSLMWVKDPRALPYAEKLWDAMQLTNFLRDIQEDIIYLDRIYLPLEDLQKYALDHDDIIAFANDWQNKNPQKWNAFQSYMKDQIVLCRKMYLEAIEWYQYLPIDAQKAVSLASLLYQEILNKIEKNDYDVFAKSARPNFLDKIRVLFKWKIKYIFNIYNDGWKKQLI